MRRNSKLPKVAPLSLLLFLLTSLMGVSAFYNIYSLLSCQQAVVGEWKEHVRTSDRSRPLLFDDFCPDVRKRAEDNLQMWLTFILALMVQFKEPEPPT